MYYGQQGYYPQQSYSASGEWYNISAIDCFEAIRTLTLDTYEELVWTSFNSGRVTSYTHPDYSRYSSFILDGIPQQLLIQPEKIFSLTQGSLSCHQKGGLMQFQYRDSQFEESLIGMNWANNWFGANQNRLILGGNINSLFGFDATTQKVTEKVDTQQGCCIIKPSTKLLCVGHTLGQLTLRDPKTLHAEHTFDCHTGAVSDIEVKGDMLVTCGFQAQYGEYYVDPMIRVYDLRTNRLLGSCHFQAGATFLKFHPMFSSMLGVASQAGYFQFIDVQQNLITETGSFIVPKAQIYQLDAQGERIEAFDLASSGENVLFGDSGGYLHIWSTNSTSVSPLNKTTRQEQVDYTKLFDQTSLSDWPINTKFGPCESYSIHPSLLSKMKIVDGILMGENPGLKRSKDGYAKYFNGGTLKELRVIPKQYSYLAIKPSKQKFQEFDFSKFNSTAFVGLENTLQYTNFVNAAVQVLYRLNPELRTSFMNHYCDRPYCLSCELGFLFSMMLQAEKNQATRTLSPNNLVRTLRVINTQFLSHIDNLIQQNVPAGELTKEFIHFLLDTVWKETSNDTVMYPIAYPFVGAEKSPKKFQKKKKKSLIEILFGGTMNSSTVLCHDLSDQAFTWEDTIRDTLCTLETLPNALVLNHTPNKWLRTTHFTQQLGMNTSLPKHFYLYFDEQENIWNVMLEQFAPRVTHLRYELRAVISEIKNPLTNDPGHCVAIIQVDGKWINFNDFSVTEASEALLFGRVWKSPVTLFYTRSDMENIIPQVTYQNPITLKRAFEVDHHYLNVKSHVAVLPMRGDLVAIDAEFVVLQKNHSAKITSTSVDENQLFSLGRVTVLLDRGPELPPDHFIDDYIATTNDTISDYMTRFSGLKQGDLDIENSTHHITDLKWTYIKLRALVDLGVIFVGHGLKNDFKIINIFVPKEQIIDTVEIYQLPRQRKISLRYLSKHLLHKDIQQETHSSEEDAATSLKLYHLYKKLEKEGTFEETLENIYTIGRNTNWALPE